MSKAFFTSGLLNGSSPAIQALYASGEAVRSITFSIQSVASQPVAEPDSMPMHQGLAPSATIWSLSAIISSQVVGTS